MGVDVSVTHVVGFVVPEEVLNDYARSLGKNEYDGYPDEHEAMEHLLRKRAGLVYGMAGSYYTSDDVQAWVGVSRLTDSFDLYDMPGGISGSNKSAPEPEITEDERKELNKASKKLGLGKAKVERFTAVLWH